MLNRVTISLGVLLLLAVPVKAQLANPPTVVQTFAIDVGSRTADSLSVTSTSSSVAYTSNTQPTAFVTNTGQAAACVASGTSGVTASFTNGVCSGKTVPPGQTLPVGIGSGNTNLAGVTQTGSTTLKINEGFLYPTLVTTP
jgi:hypothetical protein